MYKFIQLLLIASTALAAPATEAVAKRGPSEACKVLKAKYADQTYFPGSDKYTYETQGQYWTQIQYNTPACVFAPKDAKQAAFAVITFTLTKTKFALRGGGHMPIAGYNSIGNDGVLLSTTNLNTLALSGDKSSVSIGPGNRWIDVYKYLQPSGLVVVGGRLGHVGVPGLLLGGGISYYGNQYGFASENIIKYEVVLATGQVVDVTAKNSYSDLFWALKGGGNSFGIVTRFELKTYKSPQVFIGNAAYDEGQASAYLDAVYNFGKTGSLDAKAALLPTISLQPNAGINTYAITRFYDSETDNTSVWKDFQPPKMTALGDGYMKQPLATFIEADAVNSPVGLRNKFRTFSTYVSREALEIAHKMYREKAQAALGDRPNCFTAITFQPITKKFLQESISKNGNPQGVEINKAPYFWVIVNFIWVMPTDDQAMEDFANDYISSVNAALGAKGLSAKYLYLNDAGEGQNVFAGYPGANVDRLKMLRGKYDPLKIYTDLMPGGWKVAKA